MPLIKKSSIASDDNFFTDDKFHFSPELDEDKENNDPKPKTYSNEAINIEAFKLATNVAKIVDNPDIVEIAKTISDFIRNYGKQGGNSI